VHFLCRNYIFNVLTKCTNKLNILLLLLLLFIKCLLHHPQGELSSLAPNYLLIVTLHWLQSIRYIICEFYNLFTIILCCVTNVTLQSAYSLEQVTRVLHEDDAVCVEACRRTLINSNIFNCMCAFSWYIKDIIAVVDMLAQFSTAPKSDANWFKKRCFEVNRTLTVRFTNTVQLSCRTQLTNSRVKNAEMKTVSYEETVECQHLIFWP
jgi:hypothetical protein